MGTKKTNSRYKKLKICKLLKSWTKHNIIAAFAALFFVFMVIMVVMPNFRYGVASLLIKKDLSFLLVETKSGTAITDAEVIFDGKQYKSDDTGLVTIRRVPVGIKDIRVFKPFYDPLQTSITVEPIGRVTQRTFKLQARGEVARVTVKNRINGKPVKDAMLQIADRGEVRSDENGTAFIVLPGGAKSFIAKVRGTAILDTSFTVFRANDSITNIALIVPKGKVYSPRISNGLINVVSTNLDGSDAKVVVAGTGKEDLSDTQILMSPGGEYFALKSRRDDDKNAKLYVYDSKKEALSLVEQESASIIPVGWSGTRFIYLVNRKDVQLWNTAKQSLKSYDAVSKATNIIEDTKYEGTSLLDFASESFESIYMLANKVVYTKKWQSSYYYGARLADKRMAVVSVLPDGSRYSVVRDWQAGYNAYIKSAQISPSKLNIYIELDGVKISYYTYQNGQVTQQDSANSATFTNKKLYPTFYTNPNSLSTVWAQKQNDNGVVIYLGNKNGDGANAIATNTEYDVLGWYNDEYILLGNKVTSQLFVIAKGGIGNGIVPIKVGEYFMPTLDYHAFGYGR